MASSEPLSKKPKLSSEVDDLSIHPQLIHKLKEAKINSFEAVLHLSASELQRIVKVSLNETNLIIQAVSQAVLQNRASSVYNLLHEENHPLTKRRFSSEIISFKGQCDGIYTGTVTEICGDSGSGKTQLCLHLCLHAQKACEIGGLDCNVLYVSTEGEVPIERYMKMEETFKKQNPGYDDICYPDGLLLKRVLNMNQLMYLMQKALPRLLPELKHPKVMVIDSVAAVVRCEDETPEKRTLMIQKLTWEIYKMANIYGMAVICVNQVSGFNKSANVDGKSSNMPSLGLLWSNFVTTRMRLSRKPSEESKSQRMLEVVYSSYIPKTSTLFSITKDGLEVTK